jgi:hypothetical protein
MTDHHRHDEHGQGGMGWGRFAAMILTATAVMVVLMYQLVYDWDHVFFSMNRLVASLVMGCVMVVIMLGFMWPMYRGTATKVLVLAAGVIGAVALLAVNRSQALVGDEAFMRAMIPHHSIAINNARKASIADPRVRALADGIIRSQVTEIEEMRLLLNDIGTNGRRGDAVLPPGSADLTPEMAGEAREALD